MNAKRLNDYLVLDNSQRSVESVVKLAVNLAEQCKPTLFISYKPLEKLPGIEGVEKDVLRNIIFTYTNGVEELTAKLLELHRWSLPPKLVVVDSLHAFSCNGLTEKATAIKYCLMISSLINCMESLERKLKETCASVVLVNKNSNFSQHTLQNLIDLYYYKTTYKEVYPVVDILREI